MLWFRTSRLPTLALTSHGRIMTKVSGSIQIGLECSWKTTHLSMISSIIILAVDRGFIARTLLIFMPTDMGSDDHDINDASVTVFTSLGTRSTQESWQRRCDLWRMSWLRLHTKMRRSCISGHSRCSNFVEILGCKGRWHEIHSPVSMATSCPQCRLGNCLHLPLLVPLIQMALEKSRRPSLSSGGSI